MISRLATQNFKKVGTKDFTFLPGLNVLRGPNWSGKSSTLNAIKFALQSVAGVPGSKDDIPTWDVEGKCDVTLHLSGYKIVRGLRDCNIYKEGDDKPVATGHSACNAFLDDLFGIPVSHYNLLHFSDQGETSGLLTIGAAEIQKIVETVADVTLIDKVLKLITSDLSELKGKLEGKLLIDTKDLKKDLASVTQEIVEVEQGVALLSGEIGKLELEVTDYNETINVKRESHRKSTEILAGINSKLLKISEYKSTIKSLATDLKIVPKSVEELTQSVEKLNKKVLSLQTLFQDLKEKVKRYSVIKVWVDTSSEQALETEIKWLEDKDRLSNYISGVEITLGKKSEDLAVLNNRSSGINSAIESNMCEACKRPFDEDPEHLETQKNELVELESEISGVNSDIADINIDLTRSRLALKNLVDNEPATLDVKVLTSTFRDEIAELEKFFGEKPEVETLESEIVELIEKLDAAKVELVNVEKDNERYKTAKSTYDKTEALLTSAETDHKELENSYEPVEGLLAEIDGLVEKRDVEQARLATKSSDLHTMKSVTLVMANNKNETISSEITKADKDNKSLRVTRKLQTDTKSLSKYLRESRSRFLKSIWDRVLGYASTFCNTCTGGDIEGIVRDDKGKFQFIENSTERPVTCASGAQKAFMGVGVRLGLSKALYGDSSFMVLDEPSADMSGKNATRLVSTLMGTGMQIIYSTHSDLEELAAGNVIDLGEM